MTLSARSDLSNACSESRPDSGVNIRNFCGSIAVCDIRPLGSLVGVQPGLRISEAVHLKPADIKKRSACFIAVGKNAIAARLKTTG